MHKTIPADCRATVYIITVGTPLGVDGHVNLESVSRIAHQIAERVKDDDLIGVRRVVVFAKRGVPRLIKVISPAHS